MKVLFDFSSATCRLIAFLVFDFLLKQTHAAHHGYHRQNFHHGEKRVTEFVHRHGNFPTVLLLLDYSLATWLKFGQGDSRYF
jgi:hypothetical protein